MTDPWAACAAAAEPRRMGGEVLRLVESQEQVATSRLVATLAEQELLEAMLEASKPPRPARTAQLDYLLATPFRYPPLRHGSRFGGRHEPSLFYGARTLTTVLAESAYYRFVFWHGMTAPPAAKLDTQHTLFGVQWRTAHGLRLQAPPFDAHRAQLADPADRVADDQPQLQRDRQRRRQRRERQQQQHALGTAMRAAGVEAFEFVSARDAAGGLNVALFTPKALTKKQPAWQEAWLCELTGVHVRFRAARGREMHDFPLAAFQVNGALPWPA